MKEEISSATEKRERQFDSTKAHVGGGGDWSRFGKGGPRSLSKEEWNTELGEDRQGETSNLRERESGWGT